MNKQTTQLIGVGCFTVLAVLAVVFLLHKQSSVHSVKLGYAKQFQGETQERGILSVADHERLINIQTRLAQKQELSDSDLNFWIALLHKGPLTQTPDKWQNFYTLLLEDVGGRKHLTPNQQHKMYDALRPYVSDAAYAKAMLTPTDQSSAALRTGNEQIAVEVLAQTRDPRALGVLAQIARESSSPLLRQKASEYHDKLATVSR